MEAPSGGPSARRRGAILGALLSIALVLTMTLGLGGCASSGKSGPVHTVKRGENLYRIGLRYGVSGEAIARANGIRDVTSIQVGTRLWIPTGTGGKRRSTRAPAARHPNTAELRKRAREEARREAELVFRWPVEGSTLTSRFGPRGRGNHEGIDLSAPKGTTIRASESGKVIHSGRLGDYGKVVILKHAGNFRSVYAHARKMHVRKGSFVEKGDRIAEVGATGNATAPHLHFEIRRREVPKNPLLYLP